MIVYGTKAIHQKVDYIADSCPACNTPNAMQMNVFQRYAHIFWIPFFPIGKTGVSQCTHCKQVLKFKQMTPSLKMSYYNMKKHVNIPIWTFAGLALLAIGITVGVIADRNKTQKVSKMILSLKKNDILQVKLKDDAFTLLKVDKVIGDSVFFVANKFQTNLETGIDDLKRKAYESQEESATIADLKAMDKKEQILDVERN
jgi:hypothetical protein